MRGRHIAAAVVALAAAALAFPVAAIAAGTLSVTFLSVGQGDATVFEGPCGEVAVLDVPSSGVKPVLSALDRRGSREIKLFGVSHYDADHMGGVVKLATAKGVNVRTVFDRGGGAEAKSTRGYGRYAAWRMSPSLVHTPMSIGETVVLCDGDEAVTFETVSVGSDGTAADGIAVRQENDMGLCLVIRYRRFSMASCGDANGEDARDRADVESVAAARIGKVDVAKVNHHGSRHSSNSVYVETLAPSAAVISVGKNRWGHPAPSVVRRWDAVGDVFQTGAPDGSDIDGDVTISTDGGTAFVLRTTNSGVERTFPVAAEAPEEPDASEEQLDGDDETFEDVFENLLYVVGALVAVALGGLLRYFGRGGRRGDEQRPLAATSDPGQLASAILLVDQARAAAAGEKREDDRRQRWELVGRDLAQLSLSHESQEVRNVAATARRTLASVVYGDPRPDELDEAERQLLRLAELLRAEPGRRTTG